MSAVVVDTNVLVYADDPEEPHKRALAQSLIRELELRKLGAVTTQVLGEFFTVVTRRGRAPQHITTALSGLERYADTMRVLDMRVTVVFEAARAVRLYGMHYYDAQIWASARLAGIGVILSEDFASGSEVEGVRFIDPFAPGFSLDEALAG